MDHGGGGWGDFSFRFDAPKVAFGSAENPTAWSFAFTGGANAQLFNSVQGCADVTLTVSGSEVVNVDHSVPKFVIFTQTATQFSEWGNCL